MSEFVLKSDVLLIAKKKLKSISGLDDSDILLSIEEVEQCIRTYCHFKNHEMMPGGVRYVWANMSVDLVRYETAKAKADSGVEDEVNVSTTNLTSIKIGDTQLGFSPNGNGSPASTALKSHEANLDDLLMNYKEQLKCFRHPI